jgi:hypothetical protein
MPKNHWFPFLLCFISGSRSPEAFFVELGAEMSVASTAGPILSIKPLFCGSWLTTRSMSTARSCVSSRWQRRRIVVSSGMRLEPLLKP